LQRNSQLPHVAGNERTRAINHLPFPLKHNSLLPQARMVRTVQFTIRPINVPFETADEDPLVKGLKVTEDLSRLYARIEGHNQSSLRPHFAYFSGSKGTLPQSAFHALKSAAGHSILRYYATCYRRNFRCSVVGQFKRAQSMTHITGP